MSALSDHHASDPIVADDPWTRIAQHDRRLLVLDYEGALAPTPTGRRPIKLSRPVRQMLRTLNASTKDHVAVTTSRPVDELPGVLHQNGLHLIGEHGWEVRMGDGRRTVHQLPGGTARRLGLATRAAMASGWGQHLERRRCSLLFRPLDLDPFQTARLTESCYEQWTTFFERDGLIVRQVARGLELRAAERSKGTAVAELLRTDLADSLPIHVGGDESDVQTLTTIPGIRIAIGRGEARTPASVHLTLDPQESMADFLTRWIARVAGQTSSALHGRSSDQVRRVGNDLP